MAFFHQDVPGGFTMSRANLSEKSCACDEIHRHRWMVSADSFWCCNPSNTSILCKTYGKTDSFKNMYIVREGVTILS